MNAPRRCLNSCKVLETLISKPASTPSAHLVRFCFSVNRRITFEPVDFPWFLAIFLCSTPFLGMTFTEMLVCFASPILPCLLQTSQPQANIIHGSNTAADGLVVTANNTCSLVGIGPSPEDRDTVGTRRTQNISCHRVPPTSAIHLFSSWQRRLVMRPVRELDFANIVNRQNVTYIADT